MMILEERSRKAQTLPGTQKIHCVIPASKNQVQTKAFSEENVVNTTHIVHLQNKEYEMEDIRGFVNCEYDRKWWIACVLQVNGSEIQLTFCIPLATVNLSCILHHQTFCGFQLAECLQKWIQKLQQDTHICYQ
jgi:hypothetical protein